MLYDDGNMGLHAKDSDSGYSSLRGICPQHTGRQLVDQGTAFAHGCGVFDFGHSHVQ